MWLVSHAAWRDHFVRFRGHRVELRRGQLITTRRDLAKAWGWSGSRVARFLERLKNDAVLEPVSEPAFTVITICNYDKYQGDEAVNDPARGPVSEPVADQLRTSCGPQTEERKKERNIYITPLPPLADPDDIQAEGGFFDQPLDHLTPDDSPEPIPESPFPAPRPSAPAPRPAPLPEQASISDPPIMPLLGITEDPPKRSTAPAQPKPTEAEFDAWYKLYPRHEGKGAARRSYGKARARASPDQLIEGVNRYRDKCAREGTEARYIQHPATWLNQERWLDEDMPTPKNRRAKIYAGTDFL